MAARPDLSALSDDELLARWDEAGARQMDARQECKAYAAEHDRRTILAAAQRKLESLSDPERAALLQTVSDLGGIESEESVNG